MLVKAATEMLKAASLTAISWTYSNTYSEKNIVSQGALNTIQGWVWLCLTQTIFNINSIKRIMYSAKILKWLHQIGLGKD